MQTMDVNVNSEALDSLQRYTIKKSIWGANNCCNKCGRKGHFVNFCKETTDVYGEIIPIQQNEKQSKSIKTCFQCGKTGHYSNECYAGSHVKGYDLDSDSD
jgi:predicted nucleic-acid-binding Zn-ribbon protein